MSHVIWAKVFWTALSFLPLADQMLSRKCRVTLLHTSIQSRRAYAGSQLHVLLLTFSHHHFVQYHADARAAPIAYGANPGAKLVLLTNGPNAVLVTSVVTTTVLAAQVLVFSKSVVRLVIPRDVSAAGAVSPELFVLVEEM
jgi:hypothetical protein